jgi:hypothetical protein
VRGADNLTTFMCRLSGNLRASSSWNLQGLYRDSPSYINCIDRTVSNDRTIGDHKLEKIWKDTVVAYFKIISRQDLFVVETEYI